MGKDTHFSMIICAYGAFVKVNFVFRSLIRTFNRLLPLEGTLARCEILK